MDEEKKDNGGYEAGFYNDEYKNVGAKITEGASEIFSSSDIIVKVKEPMSNEVEMIREDQVIFTYLHLAAEKELTQGLIDSKSVCIAYETVTDNNGRLPLLAPMSAVAGRMSVQAGAHCLEKNQKGRGLLLGGAPGVEPANIVILGGGVVGENAAIIATGMRGKVYVVDKSKERNAELSETTETVGAKKNSVMNSSDERTENDDSDFRLFADWSKKVSAEDKKLRGRRLGIFKFGSRAEKLPDAKG